MNKNKDDIKLDTMLKNYCSRKTQVAFDVELEHTTKARKRVGFVPAVACALALVLAFSVVIFQPEQTHSGVDAPHGFSISASAAEREPVTLQNVEVELCPKEVKGLGGDITFENGMVSLEPIWFSMNGDNVETFDYKCENGLLYYVIPELKEQKLDGDNSVTQDDYFQKGKELKNIPYKSDTENYIFVSWFSLKLDEEASQYYGADISQVSDEDMRNYSTEHLQTSDDFTFYFGDTITVTAHYKDGTQETAVIEVTVDTWQDGDITYGNYVLQYK